MNLRKEKFPVRSLDYSRWVVASVIQEGDVVIDATVGNGHDTLFLSRSVGSEGIVVGFDVQERAVMATKKLLDAEGAADNCILHHCGHEEMTSHLRTYAEKRISAAVFNLGYLPGGDKRLTTRPATSIDGIMAACEFLASGGVVAITAYPGHSVGAVELESILDFAQSLGQGRFTVIHHRIINQANNPPEAIVISKK